MSQALMEVKFESLSGISVSLDAATVRNTLTRGNGKVSDQEVAMFLRTCQAKRLDPLESGEVYLIKYDDKSPANMVVGYFAYMRRADHFPDYRGFKAGITVIRGPAENPTVVQKEGACVYKALGEQLIGGWCRVFRERSNGVIDETFMEVPLDEYSTGKSNWSAKPATMIRKVAISQAFRAAFPNEYEGLYTVDEMQASGAIPANVRVDDGKIIDADPAVDDPIINQDQRQNLFRFAKQHLGSNANDVLKALVEEQGYDSTNGLPTSVYNKIMRRLMDVVEENRAKADNDNPGTPAGDNSNA